MKILAVDDNDVNLRLLETLLQNDGHEVVSALNGSEALERLQAEAVDMVISDILMPVMDGFQLCKECKRDENMRKVPFVFYSGTYTDSKDKEFALSLGAERFIPKPMESKRFLGIINGILGDYKKGVLAPSQIRDQRDDAVYMKEYNERLVNKLEKKMLDLEHEIIKRREAEDALRKAHDELCSFSQALEKKVEERTRELKEKSRQLIEAERLAALGKMANKVAHELRNPLTVIGGFARRMVDKASEQDPNRKYLQIIVNEVDVLEKTVSEVIKIEAKD
ncbi:MAG: response regulator [Thermodesulfobacteriota bacterium]|nr:response regulator [Thermodesulfobacteriota bacterium]